MGTASPHRRQSAVVLFLLAAVRSTVSKLGVGQAHFKGGGEEQFRITSVPASHFDSDYYVHHKSDPEFLEPSLTTLHGW